MSNIEIDYTRAILECFEDLLDEKEINIPSDDRDGDDGEARLFGGEYYELEAAIKDLLEKYKLDVIFAAIEQYRKEHNL